MSLFALTLNHEDQDKHSTEVTAGGKKDTHTHTHTHTHTTYTHTTYIYTQTRNSFNPGRIIEWLTE